MAVQRFLRRFQSREAQVTACRAGSAQLGVDAVDETLTGILTGSLEIRLHPVDLADSGGNHAPHSRLDDDAVGRDFGPHRGHHGGGCALDIRSLGLNDLHQGRDHSLHRTVGDGGVSRNGGADRVQHTDDRRRDLAVAVVECVGKPGDPGARQRTQGGAEIGKRVFVDLLHALRQINEAPDSGHNALHFRNVDPGDSGVVVSHCLAEFGDVAAKAGKSLIPAEPLIEQTAVRKPFRQIGKGLCGIGGCDYSIGFHVADRRGICTQVVAKGDQIFSKGSKGVVTAEPCGKAALIGKTIGQRRQRAGGGDGCLDHVHRKTGDAVGILHDGRAETIQLGRKGTQGIVAHPLGQNTPAVRQRIRHLSQRFRGIGGVLYHGGFQSGHAVRIGFQRGPEQSQFLGEGAQSVVTRQISQDAALIGNSAGKLSERLGRVRRSGHGFRVDTVNGLGVF